MTTDKSWRCNFVTTFLIVWLLALTAVAVLGIIQFRTWSATYDECKRCAEDSIHYEQQLNLTTDRLLRRLADHLELDNDARVRRSQPTSSMFSDSALTLLRSLEKVMQDSLVKECRSNHSICQGRKGIEGMQGPRGLQGVKGEKGNMGNRGAKGDTGITGGQGTKGKKGDEGQKGSKGEWGFPGNKGERGGTKGSRGVKGESGSFGEKGQKGEKGVSSNLLPSECSNYDVLDEPWRKVSITNNGYEDRCDKSTMSVGWKRFAASIGGEMPDSCPASMNRCGTDAPGWLNGSRPTVMGQKTAMEVCFRYSGLCCWDKVSVEVTNCALYYVYNLPQTPCCACTYCGSA